MRDRVACHRCGAHRDASVWPGPCLVCGCGRATKVLETDGDIQLAIEQALRRKGFFIESAAT